MKPKLFLPLTVILLASTLVTLAQNPITTLQHAGTTKVYYGNTSFLDAYTASATGDTLYLSVGGFTPPESIAKGLTIVGAGYFPDSTSIKRRTTITGTIYVNNGADNLHLEGLFINGDLNAPVLISNFKMKRSSVNSILLYSNNGSFEECCILGNVELNNNSNLNLIHNIVNGFIRHVSSNAVIDGNILLRPDLLFYNVSSSIIKNNIIIANGLILLYSNNNTIYNNIFTNSYIPTQSCSNIYESNNYFSVNPTDIFINQSGNAFDFSHNYHLKNPELYIGTDSTQVGLYGGLIPFKDGGIPSNPQIVSKSVGKQTETNGDLKINVTVQAQEN
jgi:hypothetical protein